MKFIDTPLSGACVIELEPFTDERGFFARVFCQHELSKHVVGKQIVQINHSMTKRKGTIRGLHYQLPPASEMKIIRCVQGAVFDVMLDLRKGSPTYLNAYAVELSKENMRMVLIPEGFAHGFQTLVDNSELFYLHSGFYSLQNERGLRFDDPALSIHWPLPLSAISSKDSGYAFIETNFNGIEV